MISEVLSCKEIRTLKPLAYARITFQIYKMNGITEASAKSKKVRQYSSYCQVNEILQSVKAE